MLYTRSILQPVPEFYDGYCVCLCTDIQAIFNPQWSVSSTLYIPGKPGGIVRSQSCIIVKRKAPKSQNHHHIR